MGEISAEVQERLAEGISQIIGTELTEKDSLLTEAQFVLENVQQLQRQISSINWGGDTGFTNKKAVVSVAAEAVQQAAMVSGIKSKLSKILSNMSISADHGHTEDNELRNLIISKKGEVEQSILDEIDKIVKEYTGIAQEVTRINKEIYAQGNIKKITYDSQEWMSRGYKVLAQIGELIHGTKIIYEVQLSIGTQGSQRTAYLTLDQIAQYTYAEYHKGEINLRLNEAAVRSSGIDLFAWSKDYLDAYKNYVGRAEANELIDTGRMWKGNIGKRSGDKIYTNTGNITEAFRTAATTILQHGMDASFNKTLQQLDSLDDHGVHTLIHSQLEDVLKNTVAYWQGADFTADLDALFKGLEDVNQEQLIKQLELAGQTSVGVQEKVSGASFTTLSSLAAELQKAVAALQQIAIATQKQNIKTKINTSITEGLDDAVMQGVRDLVQQFLPGAS